MNVLTHRPGRLSIEVVFDFVCPWCYLGIQRLAFLLARRPDLSVDLMWRPFLLNPDMPRQGMSRTDYMVRKFGAEDRAKRLYASITEIAAA
ncbi:MAG: DsbA family protein, partial [Acidocella sp.]|nr:DsbA family protein [Acidocella sp.]